MSAKRSGGKPDEAVVRIFDAYVEARCQHNPKTSAGRFKFTAKTRRIIEVARAFTDERTGERAFSDEELADAVRGWLHDPHNRGENDRGRAFNELDLILGRGGQNVQRFADAEREHRERQATGGSGRVWVPNPDGSGGQHYDPDTAAKLLERQRARAAA